MRNSLLILGLATLLFASASVHAGKVYKWVDKDGKVYYTNTPPPEASQQERTVLDEHGNVTDTLAAPRTQEELEADRQRQAALAEQERLAKEQAAKDHMLLQSYSTAEELEMARDGRLSALDAQIKVVSGAISSLETQLAELHQQKIGFESAGKPVPANIQNNIDKTRSELLENQKFLIAREKEQDQIREKFALDIARFKELRGSK